MTIEQQLAEATRQLELVQQTIASLKKQNELVEYAKRLGFQIRIENPPTLIETETTPAPRPLLIPASTRTKPRLRAIYHRGASGDILRILYAYDGTATRDKIWQEMKSSRPERRLTIQAYESAKYRVMSATLAKLRRNGWTEETPNGVSLTPLGRVIAQYYANSRCLVLPAHYKPEIPETAYAVSARS